MLFLSFSGIIFSQEIDSNLINNFLFLDEDYEEPEEDLEFYNDTNCDFNTTFIIDAQVQECRKITNKKIFPSADYLGKDFFRDRIINFNKTGDTLYFDFIIKYQCCAKFDMILECADSSIFNISLNDVSEGECMCTCPFYFKCKILDKSDGIKNLSINHRYLELTDEIFENLITEVKKNFFSGITTVKYYKDYIHENYLIQEKQFSRKGELISTKYCINGKELKIEQ